MSRLKLQNWKYESHVPAENNNMPAANPVIELFALRYAFRAKCYLD